MYLKFSGILVLNEIIEMSRGICQRIHSKETGAPNEKNIEKRFKCSFLLFHIVLWSFKGIFVRANTN